MDLIDFAEAYRESEDFAHLVTPFRYYVPGRGHERPVAIVLGTAPGSAENAARKAFVGNQGRLLAQLMGLAGLRAEPEYEEAPPGEPRQEVAPDNAYLTHMVKYQMNRFPLKAEIMASAKWFLKERQILDNPPVVITLGDAPFYMMKGRVGRSEDVGKPSMGGAGYTIYPMIHPEVPQYKPQFRPECEEHWQALGAWLKEEGLA